MSMVLSIVLQESAQPSAPAVPMMSMLTAASADPHLPVRCRVLGVTRAGREHHCLYCWDNYCCGEEFGSLQYTTNPSTARSRLLDQKCFDCPGEGKRRCQNIARTDHEAGDYVQ